jgi:Ca2+-binding RTX toxin-like protein
VPLPTSPAALSAVIAAGLLSGGLAAGANASPPPYKVKTHHRALTIAARGAGDNLALRLAAGNPQTLQVDVGNDGSADFSIARDTFDRIDVAAGSGDNTVTVDEANGAFTTTTPTTIDGQAGNDTLRGGSGNETILGGDGNDFVDAGRGSDTVDTGAGDDNFVWTPGEGSDAFSGGSGHDLMDFIGAGIAEKFAVAANGSHVRFTRDAGNIVMDLDGVEQIDTNALGGADQLTVGDLSGTDAQLVRANLGATDGAADQVIVNGTTSDDVIRASGSQANASVTGLSARVEIAGVQEVQGAQDRLAVSGLAGNDVIDGSGLAADAIQFTADGGAGNDVLRGGDGADTLLGGDGNDLLAGGPGVDTLDGGAGTNVLVQD